MSAMGGSVTGDFSTQVQFVNAVYGYSDYDEIRLFLGFADGSWIQNYWGNVDVAGPQTYNGSEYVWMHEYTNVTNGVLAFQRSGSILTASFDGIPFASESNGAALTHVDFALANNISNDDTAVTFQNFSITNVVVPEPSSVILLSVGVVSLAAYAWRRRWAKAT
jgi:hypothetical protein